VSRHELHAAVWGGDYRTADRSVDVYVARLRLKLEQCIPEERFIHTHFGFGYRFWPEPSP
jgi:DNA-binding response OmpR family regulator